MRDIQGLSKGIETIQMQKNPTYENVKNGKKMKNTDTDQPHPYRSEMSLVLSYTGNKSKYSTNQDKSQESDVDTLPSNLPEAMKLLPDKLKYAEKNEIFKQITQPTYADIEQVNVNTENSANEEMFTKSQVNTSLETSDSNNKNMTENVDTKNGENRELKRNGEAISSTIKRENEVDSQSKSRDSLTVQQESVKHSI